MLTNFYCLTSHVYSFLYMKCIIKQLLDSVFVICKIINVSVRVISIAFGSADNSYRDIDNSAYRMTHPKFIVPSEVLSLISNCFYAVKWAGL